MRTNPRFWTRLLLLGLCGAPVVASSGCGSKPEGGNVITLDQKDQAAFDESERFMREEQKKGGR